MKQILWWLIAGSRGGINRARIILALRGRPYILRKHHVITAAGEEYGTMYFLSESMKTNFADFLEIWNQIDVPEEQKGD